MPSDLALSHHRRQLAVVGGAVGAVERAWRRVRMADLDRTYAQALPAVLNAVTIGAVLGVRGAESYLDGVMESAGADDPPAGRVRARAFNRPADSRPLVTEPIRAVRRASTVLPDAEALARGRSLLVAITSSRLQDVGRQATAVAMATRESVTGYVRVPNSSACPRCAVLAGSFYRWSTGFQRHPRCACTHEPRIGTATGGTFDADAYLAEHPEMLTVDQAEAIAGGSSAADVIDVTAGMGYAPSIGESPEGIMAMHATDRGAAVASLRAAGFIT